MFLQYKLSTIYGSRSSIYNRNAYTRIQTTVNNILSPLDSPLTWTCVADSGIIQDTYALYAAILFATPYSFASVFFLNYSFCSLIVLQIFYTLFA